MLNNFTPAHLETKVWHELTFDDGKGNGFVFPCDLEGNVTTKHAGALANYHKCLLNPEKYRRFNKVVRCEQTYVEPAQGNCNYCGKLVVLRNQYMGACQCDNCGQWYNLSGQELKPREQWAEAY